MVSLLSLILTCCQGHVRLEFLDYLNVARPKQGWVLVIARRSGVVARLRRQRRRQCREQPSCPRRHKTGRVRPESGRSRSYRRQRLQVITSRWSIGGERRMMRLFLSGHVTLLKRFRWYSFFSAWSLSRRCHHYWYGSTPGGFAGALSPYVRDP